MPGVLSAISLLHSGATYTPSLPAFLQGSSAGKHLPFVPSQGVGEKQWEQGDHNNPMCFSSLPGYLPFFSHL